jgi:hypothetical protein
MAANEHAMHSSDIVLGDGLLHWDLKVEYVMCHIDGEYT